MRKTKKLFAPQVTVHKKYTTPKKSNRNYIVLQYDYITKLFVDGAKKSAQKDGTIRMKTQKRSRKIGAICVGDEGGKIATDCRPSGTKIIS